MTNEEVLIKQNKWLTHSAIDALGPFVKINDNYEPNKGSYTIAAGHLRDLIRDVSAELTDEQKNCPYCHEWKDFPNIRDAGLPFQIKPEDMGNVEYELVDIDHALYIETSTKPTRLFLDDGQRYDIPISYCPKCGRKLAD